MKKNYHSESSASLRQKSKDISAAFIGGVLIIGLIIGTFFGWIGSNIVHSQNMTRGQIIRKGQQNLINPLLACEIGDKEVFTELGNVQNGVSTYVNSMIQNHQAENISVYIRTLNSGRWIGINEDQAYSPASLMKVVVLIAYLKKAQTDRTILTQKIHYDGGAKVVSSGADMETEMPAGKDYTVDELLEKMIVSSNNIALYLLVNHLNFNDFKSVFTDLSLPLPTSENEDELATISPKKYSFIFMVLYSGSYLNSEMSEKALELLSKATFNDGITHSIPENLEVAHKFGLRSQIENVEGQSVEMKELHDCGIIYYPKHPYLLCVMTRGRNDGTLANIISNISKIAYEQLKIRFTN